MIFASGYDTFALRNDSPKVFELDLPELINDKTKRINAAELHTSAVFVPCDLADSARPQALLAKGFDTHEKSFASLLGISYYLTKSEFASLLRSVGDLMSSGSEICLDYPCETDSEQPRTNRTLAAGAGETMKAQYSPEEMRTLLAACGFTIEKHPDHAAMTEQYFTAYNSHTPQHNMSAPAGVGYVLARRT